MMNLINTMAIVGNPNSGKTTLFNQLTGAKQRVGNWAGVTVERKEGTFFIDDKQLTLVDLPGIYSLSVASQTHAIDEFIACEYIHANEADLVINIIDGSNLKRNLYLTHQLLEMGVPCILAINMIDIAKQRNIHINFRELENLLGCPVVPLVSVQHQGIDALKQTIAKSNPKSFPHEPSLATFPQGLADAIDELTHMILSAYTGYKPVMARALAIKLLEQDLFATKVITERHILDKAEVFIDNITKTLNEDVDILIADARYEKINEICDKVIETSVVSAHHLTEKLDKIVLHRVLGIPIFLAIMYLMFEFTMDLGSVLSPLFDASSTLIFVDGIAYLGAIWHWPLWLTAILSHGLGLGINTVLTFIPQIGLMFLCLSFLEDSGYMARAAFVMDRFMQSVGLPGKSFIPLIVGFGCNVPSVMATRTLDNPRDRLLTILMTPFMSCGARLAIFVVFAAAFFQHHGGLIVFLLYLTGILVAMLTGFVLKFTLLKGEPAPFILELPSYHLPYFKTIFLLAWQRLKGFVLRAGQYIVPVCILLGTLNAIQWDGNIAPNGSTNSVLSHIGRTMTPAFHPMGISQDNWPATVGLATGFLAKEVVVGTLNTLYTQNNQPVSSFDPSQYDVVSGLKDVFAQTYEGFGQLFSLNSLNPFTVNEADHDMTSTAMGAMQGAFSSGFAAFAYLLFVLLYVPCISTIAIIGREIGKKWAAFSAFWSTSIAYSVAVIFYQLTQWSLNPLIATGWIVGLLSFNIVLIYALKFVRIDSLDARGLSMTTKKAIDCHG